MTKLIRWLFGGKRTSIHQHFRCLGVNVYAHKNKVEGTIYERYEIEELKEMARKAFKERMKDYHPDTTHPQNRWYYTEMCKDFSESYKKIEKILEHH